MTTLRNMPILFGFFIILTGASSALAVYTPVTTPQEALDKLIDYTTMKSSLKPNDIQQFNDNLNTLLQQAKDQLALNPTDIDAAINVVIFEGLIKDLENLMLLCSITLDPIITDKANSDYEKSQLIYAIAGKNIPEAEKANNYYIYNLIQELIRAKGKDALNYQDSHGNTALIVAAAFNKGKNIYQGNYYTIGWILEHNETRADLQNESGNTALMEAVCQKDPNNDVIAILLKDHRVIASLDKTNKSGLNAEQIAQEIGHNDIANQIKALMPSTAS